MPVLQFYYICFFFFFFGWPMFEVRSVRDRVSMRVTSYSVYR